MKKKHTARLALVWLVLIAASGALALAQSEETAADKQDDSADVYTTEDLKKLVQNDEPSSVYTNRSLAVETPVAEEAAEPAQPTPGTYTNRDLHERFGNEDPTAAAAEPQAAANAEAAEEIAVEAEPAEPAEPEMTAEERTQLIEEIDHELERLEKRLLAIKNPLLARIAPPTAEERTAQQGMGAADRVRNTEEKIDELKSVLEELQSGSEAD